MARVEIDSPRPTEGAFVRYAGLACCWSGLAGLAAAVALIMVTPAVGEDRFNYPLHPTAFVVVQVLFFLQHVLLISGQLSLSRSGALGSSTAGQVGIKIAIVGTAALALSELWAISAADAAYPSRQTSIIESSFGVESLLIGVGFVLAGIAVWRAGVWGGWRRAVPLALGVYVFVVLVPGLGAGSYVLARLVIGFWMLLFALLGWQLWRFAPGPARS